MSVLAYAGPMASRPPLSRQQVIDEARRLIIEEGMAGASLRKLAARLGVTAPALYSHVTDREDLLTSVAEHALGQLRDRFESIEADDPLERLRQQCRSYMEFAVENPDLFDMMFMFPPHLDGAPSLGVESPLATELFADAVAATMAATPSETRDDADPLLVVLPIWATIHGMASILTMGLPLDPDLRSALVERAVESATATILAANAVGAR